MDQYCLYADRYKLSKVIRNLISNALKFSPKGSDVIISLSVSYVSNYNLQYPHTEKDISPANTFHKPMYFRVDVTDVGPGISKVISSSIIIK